MQVDGDSVDDMFQSRKRFRHCWSADDEFTDDDLAGFNRESDSVTVGAKNEPGLWRKFVQVSIAKAIPSLLERLMSKPGDSNMDGFNRESDSVTVGADLTTCH